MITAFAVSIAVVALLIILNPLFAAFKAQPQIASNPSAVAAINKGSTAINILANAMVIVFVIMALASCILSFFVESSPIFLIIIFIILPIEILLAFLFHDIFFAFITNSVVGSVANNIPALIQFFQWLPVICLAFSAINSIITFAKK